jgi:hypothetical protein
MRKKLELCVKELAARVIEQTFISLIFIRNLTLECDIQVETNNTPIPWFGIIHKLVASKKLVKIIIDLCQDK